MKTLLGLAAVLLFSLPASGWDLSKHSIPTQEIVSGGPPRDGIPALSEPVFVPAGQAAFLSDDNRILGVDHGGEAKAYPLRILSWHELVNDRLGGEPVLVSW